MLLFVISFRSFGVFYGNVGLYQGFICSGVTNGSTSLLALTVFCEFSEFT
jgi:hypothetical protein